MKKSTSHTGKRPKKFRILRAYSILFYGHRPIKARSFFISQIESILLVEPLFKHLNIMVVVLYEAHVATLPEQLPS